MANIVFNLTSDEIVMLRRLVDTALGDTRIEVHRTHHSPEFREEVKQEEELLRGLLAKLQKAPL